MKRVRITTDKATGGGNYFASAKSDLEFIPTGCTLLDLALGGGWVEGRIANIVGDKATGKTLLMIEACANFILKHPKGKIKYREAEAAFDKGYAKALGLPIDNVDFGEDNPFETIEDFFEDLEEVVDSAKGPVLYIVDSLDALSDRAELARDMDKGSYGADKAKMLSQLFRRLVRKLEKKRVTLLIVSQVRDKIGAMFGRKTTRSGGRALDFYATHVVYLAHLGILQKNVGALKRPSGTKVLAKIDKNKVALAFREAQFNILFGYGIDDAAASINWLTEAKALDMINISSAKVKEFIAELKAMDFDDHQKELARINKAVRRKWYEVEKKLIPKRGKYGATQ